MSRPTFLDNSDNVEGSLRTPMYLSLYETLKLSPVQTLRGVVEVHKEVYQLRMALKSIPKRRKSHHTQQNIKIIVKHQLMDAAPYVGPSSFGDSFWWIVCTSPTMM